MSKANGAVGGKVSGLVNKILADRRRAERGLPQEMWCEIVGHVSPLVARHTVALVSKQWRGWFQDAVESVPWRDWMVHPSWKRRRRMREFPEREMADVLREGFDVAFYQWWTLQVTPKEARPCSFAERMEGCDTKFCGRLGRAAVRHVVLWKSTVLPAKAIGKCRFRAHAALVESTHQPFWVFELLWASGSLGSAADVRNTVVVETLAKRWKNVVRCDDKEQAMAMHRLGMLPVLHSALSIHAFGQGIDFKTTPRLARWLAKQCLYTVPAEAAV